MRGPAAARPRGHCAARHTGRPQRGWSSCGAARGGARRWAGEREAVCIYLGGACSLAPLALRTMRLELPTWACPVAHSGPAGPSSRSAGRPACFHGWRSNFCLISWKCYLRHSSAHLFIQPRALQTGRDVVLHTSFTALALPPPHALSSDLNLRGSCRGPAGLASVSGPLPLPPSPFHSPVTRTPTQPGLQRAP